MARENHVNMTYKDRCLIEGLLKDGVSTTGIGTLLDKHRNTIHVEISKTSGTKKQYNALKAQLLLR